MTTTWPDDREAALLAAGDRLLQQWHGRVPGGLQSMELPTADEMWREVFTLKAAAEVQR